MKSFQHPNVINLIGVCIDTGEAPYLVMPYMLNGSLLSYLRKERPKLTIAKGAAEDLVMFVNVCENDLYRYIIREHIHEYCQCHSDL